MLDVIYNAAVIAFIGVAMLGHVLLFTAMLYRANALTKGWPLKLQRAETEPQPQRAVADTI